jgi:hypothetical protein
VVTQESSLWWSRVSHLKDGHPGTKRLETFKSFLFCLFYRLVFLFSGIWGFLFFRLFVNYLSQESSIVVTGADPVMSFEAQGGHPQA